MDLPLCINGSDIMIWDEEGKNKDNYHISFGSFLILISDIFHSSHIGGNSNLRFYLFISHGSTDNKLHYPYNYNLVNYNKYSKRKSNIDFSLHEDKVLSILKDLYDIDRLIKEIINN